MTIDIVVPYYNDKDEKWRSVFREYLQKEGSTDRQVTGEERYREWDCFKYFFRGIENNCKWVNKVFLIVACESQIPDWLDTSNPRLEIVYHKDYIPKKLLPTFNTMTIETFIPRIKGLSGRYIYCNDDYYFLNPVSSNMFFANEMPLNPMVPVYKETGQPLVKFNDDLLEGSDGTFYKVLNNGMDLQLEISKDKAKWYHLDHLPVSHMKNFELSIINKYYDKFLKASTMFRNEKNYSNHVFLCLYRDLMPYIGYNNYSNSRYVTLKSDVDFNDYKDCDMVCFNDTEQLDNYEVTKAKMVDFFEKKFPNKSSFEKEV